MQILLEQFFFLAHHKTQNSIDSKNAESNQQSAPELG